MRHFLLISLVLAGIIAVQERVPQARLADAIAFDFNERMPSFSSAAISAMSFGYPRLFSSFLWIRFLGETPTHKVPRGQFSWIYRDLDAILDVDPGFFPAVEEGGPFLSVITEDQVGAERLFLKGISLFPGRWRIPFFLGYHYLYEMGEEAKAAEAFRRAASSPDAPVLANLLAATLTAKTRGREAGLALLHSMIQQARDPIVRARLEKKLAAMREGRSGS